MGVGEGGAALALQVHLDLDRQAGTQCDRLAGGAARGALCVEAGPAFAGGVRYTCVEPFSTTGFSRP